MTQYILTTTGIYDTGHITMCTRSFWSAIPFLTNVCMVAHGKLSVEVFTIAMKIHSKTMCLLGK